MLRAPTGLGKTAAVTLAWAWRRAGGQGPRRLVWCLPMRTLVEQTAAEAEGWFDRLADSFGLDGRPAVHLLMGGDVDARWRDHPERHAVLIGTQDMLLSRALMRGYGMSRFGWPIDYGLLHTDALWVFDEVQLMGAALPTSTQLDGFRRDWPSLRPGRRGEAPAKASGPAPARSLWVSATLRPDWLSTAEFRAPLRELDWADHDRDTPQARRRVDASKPLGRAATVLDADALKTPARYAERLAREVLEAHRPGSTTLVILNTVRRAQAVHAAIGRITRAPPRLLVHSRFRPAERQALGGDLRGGEAERIVVATQAVEAGVDMTSAVLFTELAPVSSLIQRFGRCNRGGELNEGGGAQVRWIDAVLEEKGLAAPYEAEALAAARALFKDRTEAGPAALADLPLERSTPGGQVIRPKDFEELFDTDADLSGYDLDVSPYIRDGNDLAVQLFWRDWGDGEPAEEPVARREELCPAPIGDVRRWLEQAREGAHGQVFVETPLEDRRRGGRRWGALGKDHRLRPGQVLMIAAAFGGYDRQTGFDVASKARVTPVPAAEGAGKREGVASGDLQPGAATDEDPGARDVGRPVALTDHLRDVAAAAAGLAAALGLDGGDAAVLTRAAGWHDVGKAHGEFRLILQLAEGDPPLAKSAGGGRARAPARDAPPPPGAPQAPETPRRRRHFRHELASALAFLAQHDGEPDTDLVAFLVAAHHGKVRMGLRALPDERPASGRRIARGVQDGDVLPAVDWRDADGSGEVSGEVELDLGLMAVGGDGTRPSWAARTQSLLARHGPFRLAYLEALLRMADWRASASEQDGVHAEVADG